MSIAVRIGTALLCGLALSSCSAPPDDADTAAPKRAHPSHPGEPSNPVDPGDLSDPAARGRAEARAAIAAGNPRVLSFGLPDFSVGEMDPATGVPFDNQGCVRTDGNSAHAAAFNAEILRAVDAGELDGRHLRHKVTTRAAVLALFTAARAGELSPGDGPVLAPGGRFSVEVAQDPETYDETLWVLDLRAGGSRRALTWFEGEHALVLFSSDGETLFLHDPENHVVQTHDLPTALFMQGWEGDDEDFIHEPHRDDEDDDNE